MQACAPTEAQDKDDLLDTVSTVSNSSSVFRASRGQLAEVL